MIEGLKERKYIQATQKKAAPVSLLLSVGMFALVIISTLGVGRSKSLFDAAGALIVIGGTIASLIFQYDLTNLWKSFIAICKSFAGTPDQDVKKIAVELDQAIIEGHTLTALRKTNALSGELLADVVYMYQQGLTFDEIDTFITGRVQDEYFEREVATSMLQKASIVAPSFGLFGTVIGLVQVMQSMSSPGQIGPAMSLALLTTAYGAGLASLVFTPLAGRLEHHNLIFLESHKQLLSKIGILVRRDEQSIESIREGVAS